MCQWEVALCAASACWHAQLTWCSPGCCCPAELVRGQCLRAVGARRRDIDKTLEMLPPKHTRQTVLFSATFPQDTSALCQYALRSNFTFVDTVGDDTVDTNKQVAPRPFNAAASAGSPHPCLQ